MALINAKLDLKLDRANGTFSVLPASTRVYERDANVSLVVRGWTSDEVARTQGKTPYEPYFRIVNTYGTVIAEAKLEPETTPVADADGTYPMFASLSTNTDKLVNEFSALGACAGYAYQFDANVYSTTEANPIAVGLVDVYAFCASSGNAPSNLPVASDVLTAINTAIAACNTAIAALSLSLSQKANAADVYDKSEVYTKQETEERISSVSASHILDGQTFATPTTDRGRTNLLLYIVRALGGNVASSGIVPGTSVSQITMTASDGETKNLRIVKSGNEYTTEVV